MTTPIYDTSIPSDAKPLLSSLIGRKLVKMIRFNDDPIERLVDVFEIEPKDFFAFCPGSIVLYFADGLETGSSSDSGQNTVIMWVERNEIGERRDWLLEEWDEATPFNAKDCEPWKHFLGQTITSVAIIKEIDINDENPKIDSLPSECGVMLGFDNGLSLIISHGLNDYSDNTTIITPDQIHSYFKDRLVYTRVV